jgi:formylglycine-generating enzyme required for sulfatase activity
MVALPAGTFLMGSPENEEGRSSAEGPQHRVTIEYRFALGRYPVTFEQYDHFCEMTKREKPDDAGWGRDRRPVINVSWEDARAYVGWLAKETDKPYRLPSEAEWEYCCRARWTDAPDVSANFDDSIGKTMPVYNYPSNTWGLYGMLGGIWEWMADLWHSNHDGAPCDGAPRLTGYHRDVRVLRGGSFLSIGAAIHCSVRAHAHQKRSGRNRGFRVARTEP